MVGHVCCPVDDPSSAEDLFDDMTKRDSCLWAWSPF